MIRGLWTIYGNAAGLPAEDSYRAFMAPPPAGGSPGEPAALAALAIAFHDAASGG